MQVKLEGTQWVPLLQSLIEIYYSTAVTFPAVHATKSFLSSLRSFMSQLSQRISTRLPHMLPRR